MNKELEMVIEDYLLEKGIKPGNKGFTYLKEAIKYCCEDIKNLDKVTALYAYIGKRNGSNGSRVERAIRHAKTNNDMNKDYIAKCTMMVKRRLNTMVALEKSYLIRGCAN